MPDDRLQQIRRGYAEADYLTEEPPDLGPLRALAETAELAEAVARLADAYGRPLPADDPLAPLAREIARALTRGRLHPAPLRPEPSAVPPRRRVPAARRSRP